MTTNRVLKLTLEKHWFDMIISGIKKEEYRDIKPYWIRRLTENSDQYNNWHLRLKEFDWVEFTNGYGKNRPKVTLKCDGIELKTGNPEWGAEPCKIYFVITLGHEICRSNCLQIVS